MMQLVLGTAVSMHVLGLRMTIVHCCVSSLFGSCTRVGRLFFSQVQINKFSNDCLNTVATSRSRYHRLMLDNRSKMVCPCKKLDIHLKPGHAQFRLFVSRMKGVSLEF
jgi:hypothetical protein